MTATSDIVIEMEDPLRWEMRELIAELNEILSQLTPPGFCYHMTAEEMARPDTTVFMARANGEAAGCGALRRHGGGIGEVKRMYTRPAWRGHKIGARVLAAIEALARRESVRQLVLETGHQHHAAWHVYEQAGFSRCGPVLDYADTPYSVFYQKRLAA